VIDTGTLALCATPTPGTVKTSVENWSITEKLAYVLDRAARRLPGDAGSKLAALAAPETLAVVAAVLVAWAASHALGVGFAADVLMVAGGIIFLGREAIEAAQQIGSFVSRTLSARNERDLDAAAGHLSSAVTIIGVDAVLILLTRGAVKAHRGRYRPTVKGDASLPPGYGSTDKFGNVRYSTQGSAADQALVRYHEMVHSVLSPKVARLREFRADVGMKGYQHSSLLRYLEEALAESYAQLRVNGIKGLPEGLRFPIANGYVTLTAVATEAAIGTVVWAGLTYFVYVSVEGESSP
jgi:hypothetical protein